MIATSYLMIYILPSDFWNDILKVSLPLSCNGYSLMKLRDNIAMIGTGYLMIYILPCDYWIDILKVSLPSLLSNGNSLLMKKFETESTYKTVPSF